jgi:hypothetical protein
VGRLLSWGSTKSGGVGVSVFGVEAGFPSPCSWPAFGSQPPGVWLDFAQLGVMFLASDDLGA